MVWALAVSGAPRARGAWWEESPAGVLADLSLSACVSVGDGDDGFTELPEPWRVEQGSLGPFEAGAPAASAGGGLELSVASGRPKGKTSAQALKAQDPTEVRAGGPGWSNYVVTAEILLGSGKPVALSVMRSGKEARAAAAYTLEVKGDHDKVRVLVRALASEAGPANPAQAGKRDAAGWQPFRLRPDFQQIAAQGDVWYHLRSVPVEEQKKKVESLQSTESYPFPYWDGKWLRLRIEVTQAEARFWLEGMLVRRVAWPDRRSGGVGLTLNKGDALRVFRVEAMPPESAGFLPLDLAARFNADVLGAKGNLGDGHALDPAGLPPAGRFIRVGGVPFYWAGRPGASNSVALSRITVTAYERYLKGDATSGENRRLLLRVPRRQYTELVLLATSESRPQMTPDVTARMIKPVQFLTLDAKGTIPRWNDPVRASAGSNPAEAAGAEQAEEVSQENAEEGAAPPEEGVAAAEALAALPVGILDVRDSRPQARAGHLWLVRIPLDPGAFQDVLGDESQAHLELDLTGQAGKMAGHVLAATLVESPVELVVRSDEIGHVFVQPQVPEFRFILRNTTDQAQTGTVAVAVTDFYDAVTRHELPYALPPRACATNSLALPVTVRGVHDLDVRASGVRRQTTFAVLPPDTRQADKDSPFGMWTFNSGHFGAGEKASSALMSKIGVRWAHSHHDPDRRLYNAWGTQFRSYSPTNAEAVVDLIRNSDDAHLQIFAESSIGSGERHFSRFPPELLEKPATLELTPEETARLAGMWESAAGFSALARKHAPDRTLIFGNGYPQIIFSFLAKGYPAAFVDGLALDFLGDNMGMFYYVREVARHYGYGDVPLYITEGFYVGSARGYFPPKSSEVAQADGYINGFLRFFAMGGERFLGACEIWDNGGGYYLTGYGPLGLCRRAPEVNPKPGYAAYGTMSLLLDQAKFHSMIPVGSLNVYLLRFDGPRGPVYAAWCLAGHRALSFAVSPGAEPCLTDSQANDFPLAVKDGRVSLELTTSPVWIQRAGAVGEARVSPPEPGPGPATGAVPVAGFDQPEAWTLAPEPYPPVEAWDPHRPIRRSEFSLAAAEGPAPGQAALAVALKPEPGVSPHRMRYALLRPAQPHPVPAGATNLGVWVWGNGAARADLEVTDARGRRWHTVRPGGGYGFGLRYREPHAFDGWKFVEFPLAGRNVWRALEEGAGEPAPPLALTGLVLEQYEKVVYVNHLAEPPSPTWRLGPLFAR